MATPDTREWLNATAPTPSKGVTIPTYTPPPVTATGAVPTDPALKQQQSQFDWNKQHTLDQEAKLKAQQNAADRTSLANTLAQAGQLGKQIASIRLELGKDGYSKALNQHLATALAQFRATDANLMEGFGKRLGGLRGVGDDNDKAEADASWQNLQNRVRERTNAIAQAATQGAGETDVLRAEQMSLRNWNSNQGDVNRSFWDTLRSTNNAITDLNADTKTARLNANLQLNQQRGQLTDQYYGNLADAWTQLGNLSGQQAQMYGNAWSIQQNPQSASYVKNSGYAGQRDAALKTANSAFAAAAGQTGKAYKDPGLSKNITGFTGAKDIEGHQNSSNLNAFTSVNKGEPKRPEGASLRRWGPAGVEEPVGTQARPVNLVQQLLGNPKRQSMDTSKPAWLTKPGATL